jgi:hypothetical protein
MILPPLVFPGLSLRGLYTPIFANEFNKLILPQHQDTLAHSMDKLKLTGCNLGRVCNSKLGHAFLYAMRLHT